MDDVRDDKTGQIQIRINELAEAAEFHKAKLLSDEIRNNNTAYDSTNLFGTHTNGDSGDVKTDVTNADIASLNISTATDPTAEEMADILVGAVGHMMGFKSDNGEPINEMAKKFLVMVGTQAMFLALKKAIGQFQLSSGETNIIPNDSDLNFTPIFNTRLSSLTTKIWMFRTDAPVKPLLLQQNGSPDITSKAEGSDFEHDNDAWEFGVKVKRATAPARFEYALQMTTS